jgi:hypothetical protein
MIGARQIGRTQIIALERTQKKRFFGEFRLMRKLKNGLSA